MKLRDYVKIINLFLWLYVALACDITSKEALLDSSKEKLFDCSESQLRSFYRLNDCCIVNIAECNNIHRAWYNTDPIRPLCHYGLKRYLKRRNIIHDTIVKPVQKSSLWKRISSWNW